MVRRTEGTAGAHLSRRVSLLRHPCVDRRADDLWHPALLASDAGAVCGRLDVHYRSALYDSAPGDFVLGLGAQGLEPALCPGDDRGACAVNSLSRLVRSRPADCPGPGRGGTGQVGRRIGTRDRLANPVQHALLAGPRRRA